MNDTSEIKRSENANNSGQDDKELPEDAWMIRSCQEYQDEFYDCKSRRGRRYQRYVFGQELDCTHWKTNYDNCIKYSYKKDYDAAREIIAHEEKRREWRLSSARANNVWQYRRTPPEDWNLPLSVLRSKNDNKEDIKESESGQSETTQNVPNQSESSKKTFLENTEGDSRCAIS